MSDEKKAGGPAVAEPDAKEEVRSEERVEREEPEKRRPSEEEQLDAARKNQDKISGEHPRFKEVYAKMKDYERNLSERDKDLEALRNHNYQMAARLEEIASSKADRREEPPPDVTIDPDGYKKWHEHKLARESKERDERMAMEIRAIQVEAMQTIHADYEEAAKIAIRDMQRDPELERRISNAKNAPKAAYEYGKKKMDELKKSREDEEAKVKGEEDRKKRLEQGAVERGGLPPAPQEEPTLTEAEKRVVRNLFPELSFKDAEKKYLAQKKAMGR